MVLTDTYHPPSYPKSPYFRSCSDYDDIGLNDSQTALGDIEFLQNLLSTVDSATTCDSVDIISPPLTDIALCSALENISSLEEYLLDDTSTPTGDNSLNSNHSFSLSMEWTHKKGKKKPQQFWVYCEDKQQSYARITLNTNFDNISWTSASRMFIFVQNDARHLCFVQNYASKADVQKAICLQLIDENGCVGVEQTIPTRSLVPVDRSELELNFFLESDASSPVHPLQGNPIDVQMNCQTGSIECSDIREPFQHTAMFSFKNRVEGWFKMKMVLSYSGVTLISSYSDTFMFNNPRLKKRKELAVHPSAVVKFIQCYALSPTQNEREWFSIAQENGITVNSTLLKLGKDVFGRGTSNKRKLPSDFNSSPVPCKKFASPSTISCVIDSVAPNHAQTLKPYSYQWLSEDGSQLEQANFSTVNLLAGRNNHSDFINQIQQQYRRSIQRMFIKQASNIIEIKNSIDFECLTGQSKSPLLILSRNNNGPILFPTTFCTNTREENVFTIRDTSFNIMEVYVSALTLIDLKRAIVSELNLTPLQASSMILKKSSTGALLTKDKNLQHISPTEIIDISW